MISKVIQHHIKLTILDEERSAGHFRIETFKKHQNLRRTIEDFYVTYCDANIAKLCILMCTGHKKDVHILKEEMN